MSDDFKSFVQFKNGLVFDSTNDGMEVLGHFLLAQVDSKAAIFFNQWIKEERNQKLSSGPYYIEKIEDRVIIDHLENERVQAFETTRKNLIQIIEKWDSACKSSASSACKMGGRDFIIHRSPDDQFTFGT